MKTVVLLYGMPGQGKSTLGKSLRDNSGFHLLELDPEYVSWVEAKCPEMYFPKLHRYILGHYDHIFSKREASKKNIGRDLVDEWHGHLRSRILETTQGNDRVVVEGYLLKDFNAHFISFARDLPELRILPVEAKGFAYAVGKDFLRIQAAIAAILAESLKA